MAKLSIIDLEGKPKEELELNAKVFDGKVNQFAIHQAVVSYLANKREGNASTKTRGEVSGGGKKPWRQKGTGRARVGSIRSPLWRHGGVVFGPHPRDFSYSVPKKIRCLALKSCLNSRLMEKELVLVEDFNIPSLKTKEMINVLKKLKINTNCLLITDIKNENILRASRNIPNFWAVNFKEVNAYDILKFKKLILTKSALVGLEKRLK